MAIVASWKAFLWVEHFQSLKTREHGEFLEGAHLKSSVGEKWPAAAVRGGSDHV